MKKALLILAAALFALAGCKNTEEGPNYPTPEAGATYTFEGTVATDGFTWESSSAIGIYGLTEGVKVMNTQCKIEEWANPAEKDSSWYQASKWEGQATAPFITEEGIDLVKGENEFLVYAPYDENMSYVPSLGMIYDLSISDEQVQPKANVAGGCFSIGKSKGIPGKDEKFSFTLSPITALLKINVSSSEFAEYGLKKITLIDESNTAKLGGKFDVDVNSLAFTESSSFSKVATSITSVSKLGSDTQSIFVNLLPGDYSSTEFTVIVELESDKGTVTLPMKKNGVKCEAGKTSELNLTGLKSSDNIYAWYCPVETRKLVGCDYAYGDANCYFIQCKSAVYAGTVTPNADIPESVTIDYRLRGDMSQAEAPEGVTFEWATTAKGAVYTLRTDSKFVADKYEFTVDEANYKVTVKNTGSTAGAPILLMKKNGKILWGWSFWNVAADGTKIEPVTSGTHQVANLAIGQASTNYAAFSAASNKVSSRSVYYYQWGRYLPATFWNSYFSYSVIGSAEGVATREMQGGNGCLVFGPFKTIKESLDYPYGAISHLNGTDGLNNWTDEYVGDLWGCVVGKEDQAGAKSIYDPCPKGWRVPDKAVFDEWLDIFSARPAASDYVLANGEIGLKKGSLYVEYDGYIAFNKLFKGAAEDDAEVRVSNYATGGTAWSNGQTFIWSNYAASNNANSPFIFWFYGANKVGSEDTVKVFQTVRTAACPIRCQKDDSNR